MRIIFHLSFLVLVFTQVVQAETINVKYRATPVDISNGHFEELSLKPSSMVHRIIYDKGNSYLIVLLGSTYYHYCGIPKSAVKAWKNADSLGSHYVEHIKGNYDCRMYSVPIYK